MKIDRLIIIDKDEVMLNATFGDKTIIFSNGNSKGKTSLIRFILHGLGFKIASTQNLQMNSFKVCLDITNDEGKKISFERKNKEMKVICFDADATNTFSYELPKDQREVLFYSFGQMNQNTIKNLLGAFYIDQDVGWSMSNYGPVTKSYNTFNIRELLNSINSSAQYDRVLSKIKNLDKEIKKYQALSELSKYQDDVLLDKHIMPEDKKSSLISERVFISSNINSLKKARDYYQRIIKQNESFVEQITKLSPVIKHGGERFVLTENDIDGYAVNNLIIKTKIFEIDIELEKENEKLKKVNRELEKQDSLVDVQDIAEQVVSSISNLKQVDEEQIQRIVDKLKSERSDLVKIKKTMTGENAFVPVSNYIVEMTNELGVFDDYVSKTKGPASEKENSIWSGAILNKIVFSYRYAYTKFIYDTCGVKLPFVIDSPGASEMTPDNAKQIVSAAIRFLPTHQIIVSSVYENLLNIKSFDKQILIADKLFSKKEY